MPLKNMPYFTQNEVDSVIISRDEYDKLREKSDTLELLNDEEKIGDYISSIEHQRQALLQQNAALSSELDALYIERRYWRQRTELLESIIQAARETAVREEIKLELGR